MVNSLSSFVLKNRLLVIAVALLLATAGYYSYQKLPIDAFPDVSPNLAQVFTVTEGLAPEEVEKYVTYPVEVAMNGLPGVSKVRSISNFGLSVVNIYFEDDVDIYFARQLVNERLQEAREQIPEGFGSPELGPISTGMGLVLFYYLEDETGQRSLEELRTVQDWLIKRHLQNVPGVTEVLGIGGFEKQFQVVVHPELLLRYDVTLQELVEVIEANNLNVGASYIEKNSEEFIVRSVGLATGIKDIKNIVLKTVDGTPVYLNQVADVVLGGAIRRGLQTRDGIGEVVAGQVVKLFGTNSSTVIRLVEERMQEINKILPEGLKIVPYYEQRTLVEACVRTVTNALLQGIVLVAVVLFVFMGAFRPSIVVALSIPFSVLFAMLGMRFFGISANLMSFGGIAIAIGMMVDGTIVVVENVERMLKTQKDAALRRQTILNACKEVTRPILFAILIIIIVFLPLFTLQGVEGKTFRPLAYTVALAMFGSLLYAIFLAPVLSDLILSVQSEQSVKRNDPFVLRVIKPSYEMLSRFMVSNRRLAALLSLVILIVGVAIFPRLGSEFTPKLEEGTVVVRLTMAPSIALTESRRVALLVEKRLMGIPEVKSVVTRVGRGEVGAHTDPVNSAEMYVLLHDEESWRSDFSQEALEREVRERVEGFPGILVNLTQPIEMTVDELLEGVRAELAIKVFGEDLELLKKSADRIAEVAGNVRGAADVQVDQVSGTPQLLIKVDRAAIARYGINVADVQNAIRIAVGGTTAGQIFEDIRRFDIWVRLEASYRENGEKIARILVPGPGGIKIPLSQLTHIEEIIGPRQITREDNQRFITIQCNVVDRDIGSFVTEASALIESEAKLPPGYLVTWGGQFRLQQEANQRLMVVVPFALLLVILMLYLNFGSFGSALLIVLNIPLALVGGIVALWLSGQNLSVPSSVGFIALFGIALENGMVLVTYFNQLVKEGLSIGEASIRGAILRLRPVLMTAITTALGLIPLLASSGTGSEVQRPLATVVVGGLITSTLLTLLVIPALYKWFVVSSDGAQ